MPTMIRMTRVIRSSASILLLLVGASACAGPQDTAQMGQDVASIQREIARALDDYRSAALEGDVDAMLAHLTEDARFLEPGLAAGGEELRRTIRAVLENADIARFTFDRQDIFVHDGAAYELGTYEEAIAADGAETVIEGNVFIRWEQGEDGRWRIDRVVAGPRDAPQGM